MLPVRALVLSLTLIAVALGGCVKAPEKATAASVLNADPVTGIIHVPIQNVMTFSQSVVKAAVAVTSDLYEPTMEVSDTGAMYVTGHVIGAATTGSPGYVSTDGGKSWAQLPFVASVSSPVQGATPPPGDEGVFAAGEKGQVWMADIYAYGYSVTGWCDNGKSQCFDNRQAYDRVASTTSSCNSQASLNDREWAAYGKGGNLLLVNNPGGGPMQIGLMKVPPSAPLGALGVNGPTWNMCASKGGGIPGVPAIRDDGTFAVPQTTGSGEKGALTVVIGNAKDITKTEVKELFPVTSAGSGTSNGGRTAFDKDGTLFVGIRNNTIDKPATQGTGPLGNGGTPATVKDGRFILATSKDGGQTFKNATFSVGTEVQSLYLDGNMNGAGALLVWSQVGTAKGKADWYVAHVFVGPDGKPVLKDVTLALDEGPPYAAHVMGAAAGPDGRAYFVTFDAGADPTKYPGSTPLSVWMQKDGAVLPTDMGDMAGMVH